MSANATAKYTKILENRAEEIAERLDRDAFPEGTGRVLSGGNIHYEMSEKSRAIHCGGIGVFHQMVQKIGLVDEIDRTLGLLKIHLPYHESDHILTMAYNVLRGGLRLEDIEQLRTDTAFLDAVGAQRIPDPTTAGDFTRRFNQWSIRQLMDCINRTRERVWETTKEGSKKFKVAFVDVDGTIGGTLGECKEGMDLAYKGIWGYHPLIITLANTKEVLFLVNRPGNVTSHDGSAPWIDQAISLMRRHADRVCLRGDTDFSLTEHFDKWSERADFVFGMDAMPNLVKLANSLPEAAWKVLTRKAKHRVKTRRRAKPRRVKEEIVRARGFTNIRLQGESVAEFSYRPRKCKKTYRMVVVRKNLSVAKGENRLFDEIRYFFYITTRQDLSAASVVRLANERCDQENVIEQLKNGVNAMRLPVRDLESNWAYMVIASLAWNLKSWFGQLMPNARRGRELTMMEFRRFLSLVMWLPCQIVRTGRKIVYRILGYNDWLPDFFATWERIRCLRYT